MGSFISILSTSAWTLVSRVVVLLALSGLTLAPVAAADAPTAVVISSFTATYSGGNAVNVQWVTESEIDVIRFILYRSLTPPSSTQPGTQVHDVGAQSGGVGGATYNFTDTDNLVVGTPYYYMLKVLETTSSGQFVDANGGQPVVFGVTPTPTPTATVGTGPTSTPTPTPTATTVPGSTNTPTPTATVVTNNTATPTATPLVVTNTPTPIVTPFVTNTPTPIPGVATNTPPPSFTPPPLFTATVSPFGTPTAPVSTPPSGDTATITVTPIVTDAATSELPTPLAIEASPTVPQSPPGETPTRLPPRTQSQATATPESNGAARNTAATGLLLCLGGGAIFGAGLLAIVGFVLWRRQPNVDNKPDDPQ